MFRRVPFQPHLARRLFARLQFVQIAELRRQHVNQQRLVADFQGAGKALPELGHRHREPGPVILQRNDRRGP